MCQMGHGHGHGHGHGGGHGHHRGHGCCTFGGGRSHHCCCCSGLGWRRFFSPAEELECLEKYLEDLKKEQAGVEVRIRELKG
jgi:hypothetical protein